MLDDPFRTAAARARVLDAWAASPARFREDANAEDDYALGGYRDRLVVELAQNAADAAARAGVPGRLRLTLRGGTLTAANTGAALDAAGVESLSTLRASSKRHEEATGRFGVGFAATVAVSDAPRICSVTGAVRWSREDSRELVARVPALAAEFAARSAHVPVLRLPFPSDDVPPDGFTTAVTVPLRDDEAVALAGRLLAQAGPALLLALPALTEIVIDTGAGPRLLVAEHAEDATVITVDGVTSRWRTAADGGPLDPALLADRPAEERGRLSWSVRWAVPVNDDGTPVRLPAGAPAVVHAPTPSDEPLDLPALLLGSFPLSPDRRHVAPGPLTAFLTERAADVYARMLPSLTPGPGLLDLVPGPVVRGELGNLLAHEIMAVLPGVPFLPGVPARVCPRDAVLLGADLPSLAAFLVPLLPCLIGGPARHRAYARLGVRELPLAELADTLATLGRPPAWWRDLYDALAATDPGQRAELGALPVPLADGRLVRGPRGVLLPGPDLERPAELAVLGLRVTHPDAAHPLLISLGAVEATPRSILADPATRAAVRASYDQEDPAPVAEAVLGLVAAARPRPGELPWLASLALPGEDGEWYTADELLLPGGPLAEVVAADTPFGTVSGEYVERYGARALEAAGVLSSLGLLTETDVDLGDPDLDLDGAAEWADEIRSRLRTAGAPPSVPPFAPELVAVRDLELIDPDRWPRALELLAKPPLRAALTEPARAVLADGRSVDVPSYTAWWLRRHLNLRGRRPTDLRTADADPLLAGLYDEAGPDVLADPVLARAVGVRTTLTGLLAEPGGPDDLLARLADPARPVTRRQLRDLWSALAAAELAPDDVTPPDRVRAVRGGEIVVASADDALVLDSPDLWPLVAGEPLVLASSELATRLADLLELPLVSEEVPGVIDTQGQPRPVPGLVRDALPGTPERYVAHDTLLVDGVEVAWRCADGEVHAAGPAGLARGLAWAAGQWRARHLLAALLSSPEDSARPLAESDLDPR